MVKGTGRCHRVDIGSAVPAVLPELAFEGATRKNKPSLQVHVMGQSSSEHCEKCEIGICQCAIKPHPQALIDYFIIYCNSCKHQIINILHVSPKLFVCSRSCVPQVGELVYARVSHAHKDLETELSCVEGSSGKANGLGALPVAGYLQHCSMGLARK